jgi:hypothetical protein
LHWDDIVKTLEEMKQPCAKDTPCGAGGGKGLCKYCAAMKKSEVLESLIGYTPKAISA